MPKAAQGSSQNPTADGSARTAQSRNEARPQKPGNGDGAGAATPEGAESAGEKSPAGTSESDAVKSEAAVKTEATVKSEAAVKSEVPVESEAAGAGTDARSKAGTGSGARSDTGPESRTDGTTDTKTQPVTKAATGAKPEPGAKPEAGAKPKPGAKPEAGAKPETGAKPKTEDVAKSRSGAGTATGTGTAAKPGARPARTGSGTSTGTGTGPAKEAGAAKAGRLRIRSRKSRKGTGKPEAAAPAGSAAPPANGSAAPPANGGSSKTSALTRTTPLRSNAVVTEGSSARSRSRTRTPKSSVSPARRLSVRFRALLRRTPRWWPLPVCLLLGAGGGAGYSVMTPPQYSAVSYVVVSPSGRSEVGGALGYAQAFGKIATDPMILADAEKRAGLRRGTISDGIQASTSPDAPMVQITATSSSASQAAKNADAVAKALTKTAKASVKRTGARLTLLSEAVAPATPVSPSREVAVAVGACAGGLIGGFVLLVRPQSRRRPEYTGVPVTAGDGRVPDAAPGAGVAAEPTSADSLTEAGR
ncbi:hypothetical protein [Streptomyces sp. WMMB 322]|uniref:hypothetical protein n=1 Tax=Streptomyces sp. WMMB 322 TaxID=1286821 RepID=UPI0006E2C921|nr:hypothetical protein [Streptomyces sp. WMMB 322]SCK51414.1 Capsular polysaccharide biosynthesis protein [Streptomyces sp. WMMB 322]